MILTDLGHRLELRAESALPGLGRLEALAFARLSREGDWIVALRGAERRPVPDKAAALAAMEAVAQAPRAYTCPCGTTAIDNAWCVGCR